MKKKRMTGKNIIDQKRYGSKPEEDSLLESAKCREIIQEILNFGVSQHQIKTLIKLLALELENNEMMQDVVESVKEKDRIDSPTITV